MITIYISLFFSAFTKILQITLDNYYNYIPRPTVLFVHENQYYSLYFNTFIPFSLIGESMNKYLITTYKKGETNISLENNYKVSQYQIDIQFENYILNDLSVYILQDRSFTRERALSLGFHIINESYSIVYQLYHKKAIDKYQFAFAQIKGKLYLGGIPNDTHLSLPYKGILKINETLPTWGFNLDSIRFNNREYVINQPCIINSAIKIY